MAASAPGDEVLQRVGSAVAEVYDVVSDERSASQATAFAGIVRALDDCFPQLTPFSASEVSTRAAAAPVHAVRPGQLRLVIGGQLPAPMGRADLGVPFRWVAMTFERFRQLLAALRSHRPTLVRRPFSQPGARPLYPLGIAVPLDAGQVGSAEALGGVRKITARERATPVTRRAVSSRGQGVTVPSPAGIVHLAPAARRSRFLAAFDRAGFHAYKFCKQPANSFGSSA